MLRDSYKGSAAASIPSPLLRHRRVFAVVDGITPRIYTVRAALYWQ